jgi:hypothetical protein
MSKEYAVFGWNISTLNEKVTALEAQGNFVRGYEIPKFSGYDYRAADVVMFLEFSPDILKAWQEKAKAAKQEFTGEVVMPDEPRGYGGPAPGIAEPEKKEESVSFDMGEAETVQVQAVAPVREASTEPEKKVEPVEQKTIVVEDGSGVAGANSYLDTDEVSAVAENLTAAPEPASHSSEAEKPSSKPAKRSTRSRSKSTSKGR